MSNSEYPEPPRTESLELALLSEADNAEDYRDLWGRVLDEEVFKKLETKLTGGEADLEVNSLRSDRMYTNRPYVVYNHNGVVRADGPTPNDSFEADTLPEVLDSVYSVSNHATIRSGVYSYAQDVYLPSACSIHFESGTYLQPDGCNGIRTGDGETNHVVQRITGRAQIRPNEGSETAYRGVYVSGSKLLDVSASLTMVEGFGVAALHIDGGGNGCWWNSYRRIYVQGRTLIQDSDAANTTAQHFDNCLFRGQIDLDLQNSVLCRQCWFEEILGDDEIHVRDGTRIALGGRYEDVEIEIEDGVGSVHIDSHSTSGTFGIDDKRDEDARLFLTGIGTPEGSRQRFQREQYETSTTFLDVVDGGAKVKSAPDHAALNVENIYTASGESHGIRSAAARDDGYHFLGQRYPDNDLDVDPTNDKEIEVLGDFVNYQRGQGFVATAPNGTQYRITVDNDGNVVTYER